MGSNFHTLWEPTSLCCKMATDDLTDDYVASLLAKDAKESSIKYSSVGLEAFGRSKPPANKPKPNTRFLRNIIKDTDSHNAALLAKEAAESRARLQTLATSTPQRAERVQGGGDIRRRQLGDIAAILGGRPAKRRRVEKTEKDEEPFLTVLVSILASRLITTQRPMYSLISMRRMIGIKPWKH